MRIENRREDRVTARRKSTQTHKHKYIDKRKRELPRRSPAGREFGEEVLARRGERGGGREEGEGW